MKNIKIKITSLGAFILALLMMFTIFFIPFENVNFNAVAEVTTTTKSLFTGYSGTMDEEELHQKTRLPSKSTDAPSITILVHGQGGNASHFSNDGNGQFVYEENSLLDLLAKNLNNNVNLYWAQFQSKTNRSFYLYDLKNSTNYQQDIEKNLLQTLEKVKDVSRHTIIIFQSLHNRNYHREVYEDLHTLIDKISYDYLVLTGKIPTVNLISHSRGGVTSMMYATGYKENGKIDKVKYVRDSNDELIEDTDISYNVNSKSIKHDHPFNVSGLYSMGTPYLGTDWETMFFGVAKKLLPDSFNCESAMDILDETIQQEIKDCWETAVKANNELNLHAIAGEMNVNFILGMLVNDQEFLTAMLSGTDFAETAQEFILNLVEFLRACNQEINDSILEIEENISGVAENISKEGLINGLIYTVTVTEPFKTALETARASINIATEAISWVATDIANNGSSYTVQTLINLVGNNLLEPIADVCTAVDEVVMFFEIDDPAVHDVTLLHTEDEPVKNYSIIGPWGDLFIDRSSQLATGFPNVTRARKIFRYAFIDMLPGTHDLTAVSESSKNFEYLKSVNHFGIPHNLETHDADIINYILDNIQMGVAKTALEYEVKLDGTAVLTCELPEYNQNNRLRLDIPDTIDGYTITEIGDNAFRQCAGLEYITLPNSLTRIGNEAFFMCTVLPEMEIPSGVTSIGNNAFAFCTSIKNIELPSALKRIGSCAFLCTDITTIDLPNTVTSIGASAFGLCYSLTDVTIPNSVTYLGESIFNGCYNLKNVTLSNNITSIPENTFHGCTSLENITIPEGITEIGREAFRYCSALTNITLPYSLEIIGEGAFKDCTGFELFTINLGVEPIIKKEAFENCTSLIEIDIPLYGIETIEEGAFRGCSSLTTIRLPYSLTSVEDYLFYGCSSLTDILIHNEITSIGDYAFYGTGLTKIIISDNVASVGEKVFSESTLAQIVVSNGNPYYSSQNGILYNKEKTSLVYVPEEIVGDAIIPSGITSIASEAFIGRAGLTSVTIPSITTSIGSNAFVDCSNLTIYVEDIVSEPSDWDTTWNASNRPVFWGCVLSTKDDYVLSFVKTNTSIENSGAVGGISAPYREGYQFDGWATAVDGAVTYTATNVVNAANNTTLYTIWTDLAISSFKFTLINSNTAYEIAVKDGITLAGEVTIPSSYNGLPVTKIAYYGFRNNAYANAYADTSGITMIKIPSSIVNIAEYGFANCENLKNVIFADNSNVTYIGAGAFSSCYKLENIAIPRSVTSIDKLAFYNCQKLYCVTFEENSQLTTLANNIFDSCRTLASIVLPDSITNMGTYIFENCEGLTYAKLPANIIEIPAGTFMWCSLTDIEIPSKVTKIGQNAFWGCELSSIKISDKITEIGQTVFAYCGLDTILVESGNKYYKSDNNCLIRISDNTLLSGSNLSTIPNYVKTIDRYAFSHCKELEYIKIPSSVTTIKSNAFYHCDNLKNVVFEDFDESVTMEYSVFNFCESLESMVISSQMQTIDFGVFSFCDSLTLYVEPTSVLVGWEEYWNDDNRPVLWGCNLSSNGEYVVSFTKTTNSFSHYTEDSGISAPYRDFYMFDGWYANQFYTGTRYSEFDIATAANNVTYYIKWTQPECEISYQDIGGVAFSGAQVTGYPTIHTYGTTTTLSVPTKTGYIFGGWYLNSDGSGVPITALSATGYSEDIILYAKWTPEAYSIIYKDVGGTTFTGIHNSWYPQVHVYGTQTTLGIPTKEGYTFRGWYLSNNGSGEVITKLLETDYTSDIVLYAKWSLPPVTYTLLSNGMGYEASKGQGATGEIEILSIYNGLPVVRIAKKAFYNCTDITSVVIPSNIVSIGEDAFYRCSNIKSVKFDLNSKLETIDEWAFASCTQLDSIALPSNLKTIGRYAFYNTGLTSITIPATVIMLDGYAFYYCKNLTKVSFATNSELASIGSYAFGSCSALTTISIPSSLTSIGAYAFSGCTGLMELYIPSNVTSIGNAMISGCNNLTTLLVATDNTMYVSDGNCIIRRTDNALIIGCNNSVIPNYVTSIGSDAFFNCNSITHINIPTSVTSIGNWAFALCGKLTAITIPSSISSIGSYAFYSTRIANVVIENGVLSIGDNAFASCYQLTSVSIPASVTELGDNVFDNCDKLIAIDVDANNSNYSSLDGILFNKEQRILLTYPSAKTGNYEIPSGVTNIGNNAFADSYNLTAITISKDVQMIGESAFADCVSLESIEFETGSVLTEIGTGAFISCYTLTDIEIPSSVIIIGDSAFENCSMLETVGLTGMSLEYIGYNAFAYCYELRAITVPKSVVTISDYAFAYCTNLDFIQIPFTVMYMGGYVFQEWTEAQSIYVETDIEILGNWDANWNTDCYAMIYWSGYGESYTEGLDFYLIDNDTAYEVSVGTSLDYLENGTLIIPSVYEGLPVLRIADYGFAGCTGITKVMMVQSGNLMEIGEYAFADCYDLQNINIPEGVETIGAYAFCNCVSLENISVPSSLIYLADNVFMGCSILKSITLPDSVIYIEYTAFDYDYGYTVYAEATSIPSEWYFMSNTSDYNIIWKCALSLNKTYVISIEYTSENIYNYEQLNPPYREGYIFEGWSTEEEGYIEYYMEDLYYGNVPEGTILYAIWMIE